MLEPLLLNNDHDSVNAELAWYVNGSLDNASVRIVHAHLEDCAVCRGEVKLLRRSFDAVCEQEISDEQIDVALATTMARIERFEQEQTDRAGTELSGARWKWPWSDGGRLGGSAANRRPWFSGGGLALASLAIVGLGATLVLNTQDGQLLPVGEYKALSSDQPEQTPLSLRARFDPAIEPSELLRLVKQTGAPASVRLNNDGSYLIELPADSAFDTVNAVFGSLKSHPAAKTVEVVLAENAESAKN